jgi:ribosome maturation factor RimP
VADLDRLGAAARRVCGSYGLELFDLQFRRESAGWVLRVIVDRPWHGSPTAAPMPDETAAVAHDAAAADVVGIEDCQRVSQDLSAILDVEDELLELPAGKYTLEVSSPGLDRPLRRDTDYVRFQGRLAKIVTTEPIGGQSSFAGRLAGVEHGRVMLIEGRRTHEIPLGLVKRARLDVEF